MDLDTSWIDEFNDEEEKYSSFYKQPIDNIKIVLFFINEKNELFSSRKYKVKIINEIITKPQILNIIKNNILHHDINYYPSFILKFNIDLDPENIEAFIDKPDKFNFLTQTNYMKDITWDKTIKSLQSLNTLYILMKRRVYHTTNNATKRVYIRNKRKKTRRKHI